MENDEYKAMSREEQLQQAADEWAEFYKHAEDVCDYISVRIAYKEGAAWADEHPKNVWHSADEAPTGKDWRILLEGKNGKEWRILHDGKNGKHWVTSRYCISLYFDNWQKFAEDEALTRWAYLSELLPKGGE